MSSFTPGPWLAMGGEDLVFVARPNIAHVGVVGGKAYAAPFVVVGNPGPKGSEEADARLIAAAPDMLAALLLAEGRIALLLREFPETSEVSDHPVATRYVHDKIRAALSKAGLPQ